MGYRAHWTPLKSDAVQHLPAQMDAPAVRWGGQLPFFGTGSEAVPSWSARCIHFVKPHLPMSIYWLHPHFFKA